MTKHSKPVFLRFVRFSFQIYEDLPRLVLRFYYDSADTFVSSFVPRQFVPSSLHAVNEAIIVFRPSLPRTALVLVPAEVLAKPQRLI